MGGRGSGRRGGVPKDVNPLMQANDMTNVNPNVNARALGFASEMFPWPDPDYSDPDAMTARFLEYLALCERWLVRPMVQSCAMAFGMDRRVFWGLATGNDHYKRWKGITPPCVDVVKKSYAFLNTILEISLVEEQKNPVKWFFLAKNYFGYTDKTETIITTVDESPRELPTVEEVAAKYAALVGRPSHELPEVGGS